MRRHPFPVSVAALTMLGPSSPASAVSYSATIDHPGSGSRTITQEVNSEAEALGQGAREAGVDPRRTPTLLASGLILAVGALLLRRFLAIAPER
jgi:hypothetical protein